MKIAVIGAGVVGVASAYTLAQRGHEVHVYDRRSSVASDTSSSTAGLIAPGHSYAWASPSAPLMLARSLMGGQTSIRVVPRIDLSLLRWGVEFLRECTPSRSRSNTLAKLALARYSQQLMEEIADHEGLQYWQTDRGVLYLYRDEKELAKAERNSRLLAEYGRVQDVLTRAQAVEVEPALAASSECFAGAIHDQVDGTGDPHRFSLGLASACERLGVTFHLGDAVGGLQVDAESVTALNVGTTRVQADAYVLSAGASSPLLLRSCGVRLPIYPAKGYTVTAGIKSPDRAPTIGGIDERTLVAWSRFGNQLRMSATAEFVGYDRSQSPGDFAGIIDAANELFPDALDWDTAEYRTGLRPMTPDGPPFIGRGKLDNLFFNTGHGHVGWTMACGSAQVLADTLDGRCPDIDPSPYSPIRSRRH